MRKQIIILPVLLGIVSVSSALDSGGSFLKIDSAARAASMGAAYTALASGVEAIAYNPAGLTRTEGAEVAFSHTNWIMDSRHDYIGVAFPLKASGSGHPMHNWVAGLGIVRLTNSSIEVRNVDRSNSGSFTSYDQAVSIGLGRVVAGNRLGLGFKYLESYIAGERARGLAIDLGFSRALRTRLPMTVGLAVQNLGRGMKFMEQRDHLPLSFAAGLSVSVIPGVNLAFDAKRLVYDKQTTISFGTEYAILSGLALRSGYLANASNGNTKNNGFSAGLGINLWDASMDYAVTPYGELGNTQKVTLKKRF